MPDVPRGVCRHPCRVRGHDDNILLREEGIADGEVSGERGVKEDEIGVAVDSHVLPDILRDLNYEDPPIILHMIVPSTHVDDLWSLGCILYRRLFGSPFSNFDCRQINSLILFYIPLIPFLCSVYDFTSSFLRHLLKLLEY